MTSPALSRSIIAALRAAAEVLERDAHAADTNARARLVAESAPLETDWVQDVVAKLAPLLTIPEAAKALRMSARNVSRLLARGRLGAVRTGSGGGSSRVLIARAEIARFLRCLEVEP